MAVAYVYSPLDGNISQGPSGHSTCGEGTSPVDVAALGTIYLYVNYPTVKHIKVTVSTLCCPASNNTDLKRTVKVELYSASYCKFGSVVYGHVRDLAISSGWTTLTSYQAEIGKTVDAWDETCYRGIHVHMQRIGPGGTTHVSTGSPVTQGTTPIYSWNIVAC